MEMHPLTRFRAEKGKTLEAFAVDIGASKGMVSKWENGKAIPRPKYMSKIQSVTANQVTPADFYREAAQ